MVELVPEVEVNKGSVEEMNNNFSFVKHSVNELTPRETLDILIYESAGDMNKILHHMLRYPALRVAYLRELKIATAQAISMLRMFCEQQEWNFEDLAALGEQNYLERMQDLRMYGLQEKLKKREENGD